MVLSFASFWWVIMGRVPFYPFDVTHPEISGVYVVDPLKLIMTVLFFFLQVRYRVCFPSLIIHFSISLIFPGLTW